MIVFVIPVYRRVQLATACLRQLRRVCDQLGDASAAVVGEDGVLRELVGELGFEWVYARNDPLGRKWNDAYYHALARMDADYVVPFGSDDVVHPSFFSPLPGPDQIGCTRYSSMVSPDGARLVELQITYPGGDGVRILPRQLLEPLGFRPCLEHRRRAIDGSVTEHMRMAGRPPRFSYRNTEPLAIVDFKTRTSDQRNSFEACLTFRRGERSDVFEAVREWHGGEFAEEVAAVYGKTVATV